MKQYCRYCNNLATGNGTWCSEHKKELSDSYCKSVNRCKDFIFNPMDAYAENPNEYKPRDTYRKRMAVADDYEQLALIQKGAT